MRFLKSALNNLRVSIFILLAASSSGCSFLGAELNNRGGFPDKKLDEYWMIADTKQMRVLRSYILIGSVIRLADTKYASEREAIVRQSNTAIKVASDTYYCAYSQSGKCVYFDERMVEMELAVIRLLVSVLSNKEDEDLFDVVGTQMSETFPILKSVNSLSHLVSAMTGAVEVAALSGKVIESILKTGQVAYFKGRRLGALYRDSIELQMMAVLSSLDTMCSIKSGEYVRYDTRTQTVVGAGVPNKNVQWALDNFYGSPGEISDGTCSVYRKGYLAWQRGAGDLSEWRDFLQVDAAKYRRYLILLRHLRPMSMAAWAARVVFRKHGCDVPSHRCQRIWDVALRPQWGCLWV